MSQHETSKPSTHSESIKEINEKPAPHSEQKINENTETVNLVSTCDETQTEAFKHKRMLNTMQSNRNTKNQNNILG